LSKWRISSYRISSYRILLSYPLIDDLVDDQLLIQLTATDWKDPGTYYPHSNTELFPEVKAYGSEDPMLWLAPPPKQQLHQQQQQLQQQQQQQQLGSNGSNAATGTGSSDLTSDLVVHAILHDEQVGNGITVHYSP
jgi:hypothetical protein